MNLKTKKIVAKGVLVNFDISKVWYGLTDDSGTFLRDKNERTFLNLAISFVILVALLPTIWLTAVKQGSLTFCEIN